MRVLSVIALLLLLPAGAGAGEQAGPEQVLDQMHAAYKGVRALRATFVQTSTGMSYFEPLEQTGTISLESPGKMRWEFVTPRAQQYISDGSTLWVVDDADQTCTVFSSVDGMLQRFYGFLTGSVDLRKDFTVTRTTEAASPVPGAVALTLTPRTPDGSIDSLRVYLDATTHRVVGVSMLTPFGDRTDTVLSAVEVVADVPDTLFGWSERPGFRVIRGD